MEFRHAQPFTLEQAAQLEVPVITAEIARLSNSLVHLRDTQQQLQENIDSEKDPDPVVCQALEENKVVISSQEERISMLRLALELKGFTTQTNTHYDHPLSNSWPMDSDAKNAPSDIEPTPEADGVYL